MSLKTMCWAQTVSILGRRRRREVAAIVAQPLVRSGSRVSGYDKLGRYGHGGYLIKVVAMALAEEVTREPSPIHGL
jgi:hypothetical protein